MNNEDAKLLEAGLGNVTWWGYSPSFNPIPKIQKSATKDDEKNFLLIGAGDGRHVFEACGGEAIEAATATKSCTFWVLEQNLMLYARQMLFLALLADKDVGDMNPEDVAKVILEILGNTRITARGAQLVRKISQHLRELVAAYQSSMDEKKDLGLDSTLVQVDLSHLKHKEFDTLEAIFKLWSTQSEMSPNMEGSFESRVSQLLNNRVENKEGVFDLDYQLRLVDRGGAKISLKEYREWRSTGIGYNWSDGEDSGGLVEDNVTLASSLVTRNNNERSSRKGYWGDIVTGPFISFGLVFSKEVKVDETKLVRSSQDIAMERVKNLVQRVREKSGAGPQIRVVFMTLSSGANLSKDEGSSLSSKLAGIIDGIFISCATTHLLTFRLIKALKTDGSIWVETPLYLLHMAHEVQERFKEYIGRISQNCGLVFEETEPDYDASSTCLVRMNKQD